MSHGSKIDGNKISSYKTEFDSLHLMDCFHHGQKRSLLTFSYFGTENRNLPIGADTIFLRICIIIWKTKLLHVNSYLNPTK